MASRAFQERAYSLDRARVTLTAVIDFGASGACTLKNWIPTVQGVAGHYGDATSKGSRGILSVTKNGTGNYTVALQDAYQRLLNVRHRFLNSAAQLEAAPDMKVLTDDTDVTANHGTVNVTFGTLSGATFTAVNPGSGERVLLTIELDNSTAL
jgi:hypothetical protein